MLRVSQRLGQLVPFSARAERPTLLSRGDRLNPRLLLALRLEFGIPLLGQSFCLARFEVVRSLVLSQRPSYSIDHPASTATLSSFRQIFFLVVYPIAPRWWWYTFFFASLENFSPLDFATSRVFYWTNASHIRGVMNLYSSKGCFPCLSYFSLIVHLDRR